MSNELRQVLQEKENLLNEATGLLQEQESVHSMRLEASLSEKADIEADLEVRASYAGLFARLFVGLFRWIGLAERFAGQFAALLAWFFLLSYMRGFLGLVARAVSLEGSRNRQEGTP